MKEITKFELPKIVRFPLNYLIYKGYYTKIMYSANSEVLYGKIEGISALVSFESESLQDIKLEFMNAVNEYLDICEKNGIEPELPSKIVVSADEIYNCWRHV